LWCKFQSIDAAQHEEGFIASYRDRRFCGHNSDRDCALSIDACHLFGNVSLLPNREHPMGRPPIGARALTAAEKQRRYRERKFGKSNKPTAALVTRLQAHICKLEADQDELVADQDALDALVEPLLTRNRELEAIQAALDAAVQKLFRAMQRNSRNARLQEARREFFAVFARQHMRRKQRFASNAAVSTLNRAKAAVMVAPGKRNQLLAKEIARRKLKPKPRRLRKIRATSPRQRAN
jgi:hypothetical protein